MPFDAMEPQQTATPTQWVNLWLLDSDGVDGEQQDGYVDVDMSDAADAQRLDMICQQAGEGITKQLRGFLKSELSEAAEATGQASLADVANGVGSYRYNLARLPANYRLVKKPDPTQPRGGYKYSIAGHPIAKFAGAKDFVPHLIWLANKRRGRCCCRACNPRRPSQTSKWSITTCPYGDETFALILSQMLTGAFKLVPR